MTQTGTCRARHTYTDEFKNKLVQLYLKMENVNVTLGVNMIFHLLYSINRVPGPFLGKVISL